MSYDIIGDIHGQADKLEALLAKLRYEKKCQTWCHPERTAIFVGDFIDRGLGQERTLTTVRNMTEAGSALAIMGNHEFNAICWHTPDTENPGEHLRRRTEEKGAKNRRQHEAFLSEFEARPEEHAKWIAWFYSLPLWLDLGAIRVVHACWHDGYMGSLASQLKEGNRLSPNLVVLASREGNDEYVQVEAIAKGIEIPMPEGHSFADKDGNKRGNVRIKWWDATAITYGAAAIPTSKAKEFSDEVLPASSIPGYHSEIPVFFGHYWMTGKPEPLSPKVACVDYSAGNGGPLVAYRWEGERELFAQNFVSSD